MKFHQTTTVSVIAAAIMLAVPANIVSADEPPRPGRVGKTKAQLEGEAESAAQRALMTPETMYGSSTDRSRLSAQELSYWNDEAFARDFANSFLAESDVEPRVEEEEAEALKEIREHIANDEIELAVVGLRQILSPSSSATVDFTLGNLLFQQERLDEAAGHYEDAVAKFPKFRRAWKNLGLIRVKQGNSERAIHAITQLIRLGESDGVSYGLLGYSYAAAGNALAAESAYRQAMMLDPDTMDWQLGLARSLFRQERFADAAVFVGGLIRDDMQNAELWMLQANAYIGTNQPLRAAQNYEIIDGLGHSTQDSLTMLGDIYVNQSIFDLAVLTYQRVLEQYSGVSLDRVLRAARVMAGQSALDETARLLDTIESHYTDIGEEDRKEILRLRARLAMRTGATDEQVAILEEVIRIDPLDGDALIMLGQHYGKVGRTEEAIFLFERAASRPAFEADAKVRHAELLIAQRRYTEAVPLLRAAQSINHRDNVQAYLDQVEKASKQR